MIRFQFWLKAATLNSFLCIGIKEISKIFFFSGAGWCWCWWKTTDNSFSTRSTRNREPSYQNWLNSYLTSSQPIIYTQYHIIQLFKLYFMFTIFTTLTLWWAPPNFIILICIFVSGQRFLLLFFCKQKKIETKKNPLLRFYFPDIFESKIIIILFVCLMRNYLLFFDV